MLFRDGHYGGWTNSRMKGIEKYIGNDYFKSKTLLDVGCAWGHIGDRFHNLGANVTCADVRQEHLENVNRLYPHLKTFRFDGDKDDIEQSYDIILHWGLLYHLKEIEQHLEKISKKCNVLLLETEVSDHLDDNYYLTTSESGEDQAYNNVGIRPSPSYVEKILTKNGFNYKLILDPILNSDFHHYDWNITNQGNWSNGLRRFWICWKNVESPLLPSV